MTITYRIDRDLRIVRCHVSGRLTDEEVRQAREALRGDPTFDPSFTQLFDLSGAKQLDLSADMVRSLAGVSVFAPSARRAFVAASNFQFGMARMFALHSEGSGNRIAVFREVEAAMEWLRSDRPDHG